MKADAFPFWVLSLLVCSPVGCTVPLVLVRFLVLVLSLHWVAPVASLHLPLYLVVQVVQVVHWAESLFLESEGLELPVVLELPHCSLVRRWC